MVRIYMAGVLLLGGLFGSFGGALGTIRSTADHTGCCHSVTHCATAKPVCCDSPVKNCEQNAACCDDTATCCDDSAACCDDSTACCAESVKCRDVKAATGCRADSACRDR